MDISESHRRSSALIDQTAHQAGIIDPKHHVGGDATAPSGEEVFKHQKDELFTLPSVQADQLRAAYDNDAVAVGLSQSVFSGDGQKAFADAEAAKRPGVSIAATKMSQTLKAPENHNLRTVLQARADEGYISGELAHTAVQYLPPEKQAAAAAQWLTDRGYGDRMKNDLAFATGVKYNAFVHSPEGKAAGIQPDVEWAQVQFRLPIDNPIIAMKAG